MTRQTATPTNEHQEHVERVRRAQREAEASPRQGGEFQEVQTWRPRQGALARALAWAVIGIIIAGTIAMGVAAVVMMM